MIPQFGYCALTADFLHIGHINFLKECKKRCQKLIVGVMSDECVKSYKGNPPIMSESQRSELIQNIRFVSSVLIQSTYQFPHSIVSAKNFWKEDFVIFDSEEHNRPHADILIPRTQSISSSLFKKIVYENFDNSKLAV